MPDTPVPEQGQIVRARQRMFTVAEVQPSAVTPPDQPPMHLITLTALDDDALGETIQVLWEIEPGTRIIERAELPPPTGFDPPDRLDAFIDAVRWGAASQADRAVLQAPFRSGIALKEYQLNPLVRAVAMPRVSLLIADDVGLGKTVETGLIVQELIARSRARTALIICPAGLVYHWRDQMRDKFGLDFRIIDSDSMRALRRSRGLHVNPWAHFPRLITSIDFLKRPRPLRLFLESVARKPAYPRPFDILVIDEAHHIAPAGGGQYAVDSQRTTAIRQIIPSFEHHIFLSATPHNGYPESFTALLELLDNQRFARGVQPDRAQLDAVMVRRLKRDLRDEFGNAEFQARQIVPIEVQQTDDERATFDAMRTFAQRRGARLPGGAEGQTAHDFVLLLLKKRMLSSPAAAHATLTVHRDSLKRDRRENARALGGDSALRRYIDQIDEISADDERDAASAGAVARAGRSLPALTPEESALLDELIARTHAASRVPDSKARALIDWLKTIVKPGGVWNSERVILFTEYRDTQKWLHQILTASGLGGADRLALIYGGMDDDAREQIKAAFQAAPGPDNKLRLLLATDAASEGIDLQNYCHRLVHYDIPWNPNRLEQRSGRIDRMGQRHPPTILHFVPAGFDADPDEVIVSEAGDLDGDMAFLARLVAKLDRMREDLDGKVGAVIAQQVEEVMRGARRRLSLGEARDVSAPARALLRLERELDARIQKQIRAFYDQRHALRLMPANVQRVVETALALSGHAPLQPAAGWDGAFYLPPLRGAWVRALDGLRHPFTGEVRPIVFDERLMDGDAAVLAHLNHPLVLLAQRLLRAEVWSPDGNLYRVTARVVPDHVLDAPALIAYARLVIVGGGSTRLHEEVITAGGALTFGDRPRFARLNVGEVERALESATDFMPGDGALQALQRHWEAFSAPLRDALQARMRDRHDSLIRQLEERRQKDHDDIAANLTELEQAIRRELGTGADQMILPGFSPAEQDQMRRDIAALGARLERIPHDIAEEQRAIAARYADPTPRLFPAAVALLVPARMVR